MSTMESVFRLSVIINMIDNLTRPMVSVKNTVNESVDSMTKLQTGFANMAKSGTALMGIGSTITNAVTEPVKATFETKKAIGELSSLGIQNLNALENKATEFSNKWAGTTKADFISAAYDIKSGIESLTDEGVAKFTELSGITATATKASVATMTDLFATGYGIYKGYYQDMSDLEFGEMFSAGIAKSVQQFKTNGTNMASAIQSLGASATQANVPMEEQFAILGMLQATMSGSEAGTKYSAFLRSAAKAGDELGLTFVDANNQLLSMPEILSRLRGKYGETLDAIEKQEMTKAFGTEEAIKMIDLLYGKTGDLQSNILGLFGSMGQGIDLTTGMADAINNTDYSKYQILKQQAQNANEVLGNALSPTVMELTNKFTVMTEKFGTWAGKNQELVGVIMKIALALGIFITIGGGTAVIVGVLGFTFTKLVGVGKVLISSLKLFKSGFTTLRIVSMYAGDGLKAFIGFVWKGISALPGLIASVWSFTAALLANPITWIVIGVIALIAALILLWKNWDKVTQFLSGVWSAAMEKLGAGFDWIKGKLAGVGEFFSNIWTNITSGFTNAITNFLPNVKESGSKIISTLGDGIKAMISKPAELVKEGLQKIRNMLPFSDAKIGPLSKLTLSGKRIFTTITTGMNATKDLPGKTFGEAMDFSSDEEPTPQPKKPGAASILKELIKTTVTNNTTTKEEQQKKDAKGVVIQKLEVNLDIKDLRHISLIEKLLQELEDINNSNPDSDDDLVLQY